MGCSCGPKMNNEDFVPTYAVYPIKVEYDFEGKKLEVQKHGIISKIMGKKVASIFEYETHIVVKDPKFIGLKDKFLGFINEKCQNPWESTSYIVDSYLSMNSIPEFMVQGEKDENGDIKNWFFVSVFDGCGEVSMISSQVATHWFDIFIKENQEFLKEFLSNAGLTISEKLPEIQTDMLFLPLAKDGYAKLHDRSDCENDACGCSDFDLDGTLLDQADDSAIKRVDEIGMELMADGICKCQMCSLDFDLKKVERLTIFDSGESS